MSPQQTAYAPTSHAALYVPAGTAPAGVTLDSSQTTAHISLDGTKLIASADPSIAVHNTSRATTSGSNLRYYCEAAITAGPADQYFGLGLADSTHVISTSNILGFSAASVCAYGANQTYYNAANQGSWTLAGSTGPPRIIQMAADLKIPRKVWFRLDTDASWNAGAGVPNAGGGYDISTFATDVFPTIDMVDPGVILTLNFGATAYVGTMPLGYTNWGALEPSATAIWDGANKTSNVTLPTTTTAAVGGTPTDNEAVRVTTSHPMPTVVSKWYGKFQVTKTGGLIGVGVVNNSFPMGGNTVGADGNSIAAYSDGNIVANSAVIGTWTSSPAITGDTIELCIGLTSSTIAIWARRNTGNWNNSGTADPTTNTGGVGIGFGGLLYLTAAFRLGSSGSSLQLIDGMPPGGGYCHW